MDWGAGDAEGRAGEEGCLSLNTMILEKGTSTVCLQAKEQVGGCVAGQ